MPGDVVVGDADGVAIILIGQLRDTVISAKKIQANELVKRAAILVRLEGI